MAERNNPKDALGQPKRAFKPEGAPTSVQQAEWQASFGRGTPHNLWGIYRAAGLLDSGGVTFYLGDDGAWHSLNPSGPTGASRQGSYS